MTELAASHKRRLTGLFGLLALVAIAGSLALNRSASADPANLLLQQPDLVTTNPAKSGLTRKTYTELTTDPGGTGFLNDLPVLLYGFAGAFTILAFFAGAYSYFLSGGNEENMNKGRAQMIGSLIAFFIIASASAIVGIFGKFFSTGKPF